MVKTPKFNHDQAEYLLDALSGETWQVLDKWIEFYVEAYEKDVLDSRVQIAEDEKKLIYRKVRADGARNLLNSLRTARNEMKKRDQEARKKSKEK